MNYVTTSPILCYYYLLVPPSPLSHHCYLLVHPSPNLWPTYMCAVGVLPLPPYRCALLVLDQELSSLPNSTHSNRLYFHILIKQLLLVIPILDARACRENSSRDVETMSLLPATHGVVRWRHPTVV